MRQYTEDPEAPFTVLVWATKESGTYLGGPIGLTGAAGQPLTKGDLIEVVGRVGDLVTYDSIGGSITIPTVEIEPLRLVR